MQRRKVLLSLMALGSLLAVPSIGSAAEKTNSPTTAVSFPVPAGTTTAGAFPGGNFVGTLTVTSFQVINGVLNAVGTLTGNLVTSTGATFGPTVTQTLNLPLAVNGSCPILNLTLGPLDLNLLGLQVHLNQIVLNITAQPGNGNLLGNLLCAVANLLNSGGPVQTLLNQLANLLNQILAAL